MRRITWQGGLGQLVLVGALTATSPVVGQDAAQGAGGLAPALRAFTAAADRPESERRTAAAALGAFDAPAVTAALLSALAEAREPGYRLELVQAIGARGRDGAVPALAQCLDLERNARVRDAAAVALAAQGDTGIAALVAAVGVAGPDPGPRSSALVALGRSGAPAAIDCLLAACRSGSRRARLPAVRALEGVRDARVAALLRELAADRDAVVAGAALRSLAEAGDAAAPPLAWALSRRGVPLSTEAHTAILRALLAAPEPRWHAALLGHAAAADDALGATLRPGWERLIADAAFVRTLLRAAAAEDDVLRLAVVADLLGLADPDAAAIDLALQTLVLRVGLRSGSTPVVACAVAALARRNGSAARAALRHLAERGRDAASAAMALAALARIDGDGDADDWIRRLLRLAAVAPSPRQAEALHLLAEREPRGTVDHGAECAALARPLLQAKSASVRLGAIALAATADVDAVVPDLLARLEVESGRLQAEVIAALVTRTGRAFTRPEEWLAWWRDGAPPAADAARPAVPAATVQYWTLPVVSERLLFAIDASGSMELPFGGGSRTRWQHALHELQQVLRRLPATARCDVAICAGAPVRLVGELAAPAVVAERLATVHTTAARGPTDLHAALAAAFATPDIDTVYLLTDGWPSVGRSVDPDRLLELARLWNAGRRIAVHAIALGGENELLRRLAAATRGVCVVAR